MSAHQAGVLAVLDEPFADWCREQGIGMVEYKRRCQIETDTRITIAELIEAADGYYTGYCQDEAADDGVDFTGCSQEQHEAAARLRRALARATGTSP